MSLVEEINTVFVLFLHKTPQGLKMFPAFYLLHWGVCACVHVRVHESLRMSSMVKNMEVTGNPGRFVSDGSCVTVGLCKYFWELQPQRCSKMWLQVSSLLYYFNFSMYNHRNCHIFTCMEDGELPLTASDPAFPFRSTICALLSSLLSAVPC